MPRSITVLLDEHTTNLTFFDFEVGLCTGYTVETNGDLTPVGEPTEASYGRVTVLSTAWSTPVRDGTRQATVSSNTAPITFPSQGAESWAGGQLLTHIVLYVPDTIPVVHSIEPIPEGGITVLAGGAPATFAAGELVREMS